MFELIAFGFKLFFSLLMTGIFGYFLDTSLKDRKFIISLILVSLFSTAMIAFCVQLAKNFQDQFIIGPVIMITMYITNEISRKSDNNKKMFYIFSTVIGIIIGFGYLIQTVLLVAILCFIYNYDTKELFNSSNKNMGEDIIDS